MLSKRIRLSLKTLQVHSEPVYRELPLSINARKASLFASFQKASFTIEAAVFMPIVILAVCSFYWLIMLFRVQMTMQGAMWEVTEELSGYAYLYEQVRNLGNEETEYVKLNETGLERWLVGGITEQYIEQRIVENIGRDSGVWDVIDDGTDGIEVKSMLGIPDADGVIDVVVVYKAKNPFMPVPAGGIKLIQRCYVNAWLGYDIRDEEEPVKLVYVAETGEVYHPYSDCTYLKPNIMLAACHLGYVSVKDKEIYEPCEICVGKGFAVLVNVKVYITETGEKYHKDISCRTLKRTVYEVPFEEAVQKYRKCSRCAKREEKEHASEGSGDGIFSNWDT